MCIVVGFFRETESIGSLYVQKEIHVEELASVIMETGEPTCASQAGKLGPGELIVQFLFPAKAGSPRDPREVMVQMKTEGWQVENSLLLGEGWLFGSIQASSDWIGTHQHYGGQSTLLIKTLIVTENTLAETPRIMFDEISMPFHDMQT